MLCQAELFRSKSKQKSFKSTGTRVKHGGFTVGRKLSGLGKIRIVQIGTKIRKVCVQVGE